MVLVKLANKTVTIGSEAIKDCPSYPLRLDQKVRINIPGIDHNLWWHQMISLTCVNCLNHLLLWVVCRWYQAVLVYASYGVEVTVVADRIIPAMDKEVSLELKNPLAKKGYGDHDFCWCSEIVEANNNWPLNLIMVKRFSWLIALLSIGRVPQLDGLENLNLELDRGRIQSECLSKTSIPQYLCTGWCKRN